MHKFSRSRAMILAVVCLACPVGTHAQGGPLEEIVVTATKRSQSLQEIPVAVSVTSGETIEKAQIQDIADLQSVVPSLRVSQLQNSTNTNFTIRGFGNGANNPGIEPSVGVFIDGVYRSRSAAAISDLPKLDRIEVLRGPQSTLFGKNASAGVISVVTAKPSGEQDGWALASFGNFGEVIAKGYYENAITDNVAFSVSASSNTRDGYATNLVTGSKVNDRDRQAFRGQLLINPSADTEIRLIADYDTLDEKCCFAVNILSGPTLAAINLSGGQVVANDPEALTFFGNVDPTNELDNSGISMQVDHAFSNLTLTSITSLRNVDSLFNIDADFTSSDILDNRIATDIDTFTQEIRLASTGAAKLDWMIGGYYFDESIDYVNALPFGVGFRPYTDLLSQGGVSVVEAGLGLPVGTFGNQNIETKEQSTLSNQAYSIFATLDYPVSEQLTATIGLNYTKDEKQASTWQLSADPFSALDLVQIGGQLIFQNLVAQGVPSAAAQQQAAALASTPANPLLPLRALQFLPPFVDYPNAVENGKTDDDKLTYSARLAYDINDGLHIYAGVSTGFKASSWNLSRDARPSEADFPAIVATGLAVPNLIPGSRFADPENATVYELGLKAKFARGFFNMAIFDQSIKGFQSNLFNGSGFNLVNAGEQSTTGLEFDLAYYPTEALKLTLAATFLDPVYDSFTQAARDPQTGAVTDLSGRKAGGINEVSFSAGASYNFLIGNNTAYVRADYFYEDTIPINDDTANPNTNVSRFTRDSRNLNISAGITTENELGITLWGRNVTDHVSLISAFPAVVQVGSFTGYRTQPRTYGITLSKTF